MSASLLRRLDRLELMASPTADIAALFEADRMRLQSMTAVQRREEHAARLHRLRARPRRGIALALLQVLERCDVA